ncbi:flagellar filament capping protein FliD [Pseudomonas sp. NPDC090202]|uniref:flagellar filament capping protein FliD n=1 Tax=unclassified Pseudomonas TaxID=196821 RepID=UPI0038175074
MASPITPSTGLGSGLAIGEIVAALVNSDKLAKQTQITTQTKQVTTRLSGIGTLQSAVAAFQAALKNLGNKDAPAFAGYAAKSSNESALTVTSNNNAVPGTYTIKVSNIATSSSVATAAFPGGTGSAVPSGSLSISQNGVTHNYDIPAGATLESVARQINAQSKTTQISANLITDNKGTRLVFGSTVTGKDSEITTRSSIPGFTIAADAPLDSTSASSAGYLGARPVDANYSLGGMPLTSASNKIEGVVGGLTLNLVGNNSESTVTVSTNTDGLKTSLQSFITAYNAVVSAVSTVTKATINDKPDPTTGATVTPAALTGDAMPRAILSAMRNQLVTSVGGGNLSVLSQLGIMTSQTDGTLSLDDNRFKSAMNDKGLSADVQRLFSGNDGDGGDGLLARMNAALTPYTQTGGLFDSRKTSLNKQQSELQDQQAALNLRVANLTTKLTAKYNAMDLLVGQLKASAANITSFFDSLNAQKSR